MTLFPVLKDMVPKWAIKELKLLCRRTQAFIHIKIKFNPRFILQTPGEMVKGIDSYLLDYGRETR